MSLCVCFCLSLSMSVYFCLCLSLSESVSVSVSVSLSLASLCSCYANASPLLRPSFLAAFAKRTAPKCSPKSSQIHTSPLWTALGTLLLCQTRGKTSLCDLTFYHVFIDMFPPAGKFPSNFWHFCFSFFADSLQGAWTPFL